MAFDPRAVRHAYEAIAERYAETFGDELQRSDFDRSVLDRAVAELDRSPLVLDLGCGPGQIASYLGHRGCRAVGLDLTPAMLDMARRRGDVPLLIGGDALALPVRSRSFDGFVAWYSLHNLPRPLLTGALAEARRVLRDRGVLLLGTHAGRGEEPVDHEWEGQTEEVVISYYEPDELASLLSDHAFEVVDVRQRPPLDHEHAVTKLYVTAIAK